MDYFIKIPERLNSNLEDRIKELDILAVELNTLESVSPSPRIHKAYDLVLDLVGSSTRCSIDAILQFHQLIGESGEFRGIAESFWSENNIGIRGYHPAPSEKVAEILNIYFDMYNSMHQCEHPLLRIAAAYLNFSLIHPFLDGNGRVGRLIAAQLMYVNKYEALAPYLEPWFGNENKEHGKVFDSEIKSYLAWCNPSFSSYLNWYADRFFTHFLQELITNSKVILKK